MKKLLVAATLLAAATSATASDVDFQCAVAAGVFSANQVLDANLSADEIAMLTRMSLAAQDTGTPGASTLKTVREACRVGLGAVLTYRGMFTLSEWTNPTPDQQEILNELSSEVNLPCLKLYMQYK